MKSQKGQKKPVINALNKKRKRSKNKKQEENLSDNIKTTENENELSKLKNIHFYKCIVEDADDSGITDREINLFEAFKSINNIPYLVYINKDNAIVFYDLNVNQKQFAIKNAHEEIIGTIRYFLDKINKRDLLLTISYQEGNIKVWNIKSKECIFEIDSDWKKICSANFFYYENQINIIAIYDEYRPYSEINVYNLNNDEIEKIKYFHGITYFLKTFYSEKNNNSYIITGHDNYIISYDYNNGKQYRQYRDGKSYRHSSAVIYEKNFEVKLIESCWDGYVRIWNFDSGKLLQKIDVIANEKKYKKILNGLCLWDNDYVFVGYEGAYIILIDIKNGNVIKKVKDDDNAPILSIEKISTNLGEFLITQEFNRNEIKLWLI